MSVKTWVLVEPSGAVPAGVAAAISHPGIEGVAFAQPWDLIETAPGVYDFTKVNQIAAIAQAAGKKMSLRIRGGVHTPSWAMGRTWVPTAGQAAGSTIPCPCETTGVPNATFVTSFTNLFNYAATWCLANSCYFLHFTWFGGLSAELFETDELLTLTGCSSLNVRAAHFALLHMAEALSSAITIEFPASGFTVPSSGLRGAIATEMSAHNRPQYLQENNLDDGTWHVWPYSFKPHGNQMVHAQPPSPRVDEWDWNAVYANEVSTLSDYVEIQFDCFNTNANKALLYSNALTYAPSLTTTSVFPAGIDSMPNPVAGTPLHIVGRTPRDRIVLINDGIEAVETAALVRTSPDVAVPDAFLPLPELLLNDAETITGWSGATLDAALFTHGTHSVKKKIRSDPGFFLSHVWNAPAPISSTGYGTLSFDIQWQGIGTPVVSPSVYDLVVADGTSFTGNVVRVPMTVGAEGQWNTVDLDISSLTSVRSVGIQGVRDSGSAAGSGLTWWIDYIRFDAQTPLGAAVTEIPGVMVAPSYPPEIGTHISYDDRTVLDTRPASALLQRHGGVRHIREWNIAEDGSEDVSLAMSAIIKSLPAGSTLLLSPDGQYLNDGIISVTNTDLTLDGQGAIIFTSRDRGDIGGTNSNPDDFMSVTGNGITIRNLSLIGGRTLNINMVVSVGAMVPPTPFHLTHAGDEIMTDPAQVYYCGRDKDGLIKIDVGVIKDTAQVPGDCLIRMVDAVTGLEMTRMNPVLTSVNQPFTIAVDGAAWLGSMPRAFISKVTSTPNDIAAGAGTKTLYNPVDYRATHDSAAGILIVSGVGITIEDVRVEGIQTDAVESTSTSAEYLTLRRVQSICNSRQGFSFNKGRNVVVQDCVIREIARTGIDIEPYSADWSVWHVTIRGCQFANITSNAISCNNYLQIWYLRVEDCVATNCGLGFAAGGGHFAVFRNIRNFGVDFTPRGRNMTIDHITTDGQFSVQGMSGSFDASISASADPEIQALGNVTYSGSGNMVSNITVTKQAKTPSASLSAGTNTDVSLEDDTTSIGSYPYYGPIRSQTGEFSALNPGKYGDIFPDTFKGLGFSSVWVPGGINAHDDPVSNVRALGGTQAKGNNLSAVGVSVGTGATTATVTFPTRTLGSLAAQGQPSAGGGGALAAGTYYIAAGPRNRWGPKLPTAFTPVTVAANGVINLTFTTGWDTTTELIPGITWFRAGPAASLPPTYNVRYDWMPSSRFYGGRRVLGMSFRDTGTSLDFTNLSVSQDPQIWGYPSTVAPQSGSWTLQNETGWEPDTAYGVMVETSWPTNWSITAKRQGGFDIAFQTAAPAGATFSWLLIR